MNFLPEKQETAGVHCRGAHRILPKTQEVTTVRCGGVGRLGSNKVKSKVASGLVRLTPSGGSRSSTNSGLLDCFNRDCNQDSIHL
jgi:hypothetical protein